MKNENNNCYSQEILNIKILKLTEIAKKIKEDLNKISKDIKSFKLKYNTGVLEYKIINNKVLSEEEGIEEKKNLISKIKKRNIIILQSINGKEFNFLQEMTKEKSQLECFKYLFEFCGFNVNDNFKDILKIIKFSTEFVDFLKYAQKRNENIFNNKNTITELELIKKKIKKFLSKEKSFQNPFDIIFEYIQNIYKLIKIKEDKKNLEEIMNKDLENKNNQFLKLKLLENDLVMSQKKSANNHKFLKLINIILNEYQNILKENNNSKSKIKELNSSLNLLLENEFDPNEDFNDKYDSIINNLNIEYDLDSDFSYDKTNYFLNNLKNYYVRGNNNNKEITDADTIDNESIGQEMNFKDEKFTVKPLRTARVNGGNHFNRKIKKELQMEKNIPIQKNLDKSLCTCNCQ